MIQAGVFLLIVAGVCALNGLMGRFIASIPPPPARKRPDDIWASTYSGKAINRTAGYGRSVALVNMTLTLFKIALGSLALGVPLLLVGIALR